MESIIDNMEITAAFNSPDGKPPYAYKSVEAEGKVSWFCGYDEDEILTSVFVYRNGDEQDRRIQYVEESQAMTIRDQLVLAGWVPVEPPKISLSYGDRTVDKPLKARKVKRFLDKESKKFDKKHPQ